MDIEHCLTVQQDNEVAKFTRAADKTLTQRLLYKSATRPQTRQGFGRLTMQKYK